MPLGASSSHCHATLSFLEVKMKFRKKPVVVDATQWHSMGDHPMVTPYAIEGFGWIPTLEGGHIVSPGDWIITGVKGEHYPCKPDIFEATYEPVMEEIS